MVKFKPIHFIPGKEMRYPWNRGPGGPQSLSEPIGEEKNLLSPPGFELWTMQSVAYLLYLYIRKTVGGTLPIIGLFLY